MKRTVRARQFGEGCGNPGGPTPLGSTALVVDQTVRPAPGRLAFRGPQEGAYRGHEEGRRFTDNPNVAGRRGGDGDAGHPRSGGRFLR